MRKWEEYVYKEYVQADKEFVDDFIPFGSVDLSSYGLIADATGYSIVDQNGEMKIMASVGGFDELKKALKQMPGGAGGVKRSDAFECMKQLAQIWEEKIRQAGKWEEMIRKAREQGEVVPVESWAAQNKEKEESKGFLDLFKNIFR